MKEGSWRRMAEGKYHKDIHERQPNHHVPFERRNHYGEMIHNINSLNFDGNSCPASGGFNTQMVKSATFNNQIDPVERSNTTMDYPSSGGFTVSRGSDGAQSSNCLDSLPFDRRNDFTANQTKTREICLDSYNSFYASVTSSGTSSRSTKSDNLSYPSSADQGQSVPNIGNPGENTSLNPQPQSRSTPNKDLWLSNRPDSEYYPPNNLQMRGANPIINSGPFEDSYMPSNCSIGFSYHDGYGKDTSVNSNSRHGSSSISSNLQSNQVQLGTDTGEFEPCLTDSGIGESNDICQLLSPNRDSTLEKDGTVKCEAVPKDSDEELITVSQTASDDVQHPSRYLYDNETKSQALMREGNQTRMKDGYAIDNTYSTKFESVLHDPKTEQHELSADSAQSENQRFKGQFESFADLLNDVHTLPDPADYRKKSSRVQQSLCTVSSQKDEILGALNRMTADMNGRIHCFSSNNDNTKDLKSNKENLTTEEQQELSSMEHYSYTIVIDKDRAKEQKTEMEEDGNYQIIAHWDALTIYDGLGRRPVMFDALMCVAPEDVLTFAVPFLQILRSWGFLIFLPQRDLNLTGPYHENLARVLRERCRGKVIVVVSENYSNSDECLFLTNFARVLDPAAKMRSIIPLYIDKNIPNLPNVLTGLSSIRYNEAVKSGFLKERMTSALQSDLMALL